MRALSTRVNNMKQEMNPVPSVRPARSQPKARVPAKQLYLRRTVRVFKGGAANVDVPVTVGDLVTALGAASGTNVNFKVLGFSVWNFTPLSQNTNYLKVVGASALFTDSSTVCEGEDVGNGTSLAGVKVNVPDLAADTLVGTTVSSTTLANLSGSVTGATTNQTYCADFHLTVQVQ